MSLRLLLFVLCASSPCAQVFRKLHAPSRIMQSWLAMRPLRKARPLPLSHTLSHNCTCSALCVLRKHSQTRARELAGGGVQRHSNNSRAARCPRYQAVNFSIALHVERPGWQHHHPLQLDLVAVAGGPLQHRDAYTARCMLRHLCHG